MKSMKWLGILVLGISMILFLAACQPTPPSPTAEPEQAEPTTTTASPTATAANTPTDTESYPAPDIVSATPIIDEGYPAPTAATTGGSTPSAGIGSGYPEPEETIPWEQARSLILGGQVTQVTQLHSQKVILVLEDGRTVETYEPAIDEVFAVIDECGEACSDIVVATE